MHVEQDDVTHGRRTKNMDTDSALDENSLV